MGAVADAVFANAVAVAVEAAVEARGQSACGTSETPSSSVAFDITKSRTGGNPNGVGGGEGAVATAVRAEGALDDACAQAVALVAYAAAAAAVRARLYSAAALAVDLRERSDQVITGKSERSI